MPEPVSSSSEILLSAIDAFAEAPFQGNPAGVCLLPAGVERSSAWMQKMASELNLPATAFLQPWREGDGFHLRWFTVKNELELCGHGTLASTHFLWERGFLLTGEMAHYDTRAGGLSAVHDGTSVQLDFPAKDVEAVETPDALQVAIGENEMLFVGRNKTDLLIELATEEAVRELQPNLDRLSTIDVRGAIVTARATGEYDFVSRCFFPRSGMPEDAVTGSAHCALAPYWAKKLGKRSLLAYQASARGGVLRLQVVNDRVLIRGSAVTVWSGALSASV